MSDEQQNGNGRFRVSTAVVMQIGAWVVAALLTYGAVTERVAVLEARVNGLERQLERIELKLDRALGLK